jgi:hypothetical protein
MIQEEMFQTIMITDKMNLSYYYGSTIKDRLELNMQFHNRLRLLMKPDIFNSQKDFNKFMVNAIKIYNEEVLSIVENIGWEQDLKK